MKKEEPLYNKDIKFKKIKGIKIEKFRSITDKEIPIGNHLTIISGKNGTMKSTLLGLIAHPFSSPTEAKDIFGNPLKTSLKEVFNLSLEKDQNKYIYYLKAEDIEGNYFETPIRVYPSSDYKRHRITVGKSNEKGLGNFSLNTSYLNFKRLYPIVDTNSEPLKEPLSDDYKKFISKGYNQILQKKTFENPELIEDKSIKTTFGPTNTYYDYVSISSGEDNLGHILSKLFAFEKNPINEHSLNGILCIDEIEAGFHPVAQKKLIEYLYKWSIKNKVQVVATSHSLYLIQHLIEMQKKYSSENIMLNIISTQFIDDNDYNIIVNPDYSYAYKELTYSDTGDTQLLYKPSVIMEDKLAIVYLKRIIKERKILNKIDFLTGLTSDETNSGMSYKSIFLLIDNGKKLFSDTIFILDPDVNIERYKDNCNVLKLPSTNNLCIEKTIVHFIYSLKGSDDFFKKYNRERDAFISDFSDFNIHSFEIVDLEKANSKNFKKWADSDSNFETYITYYINYYSDSKSFVEFKINFIKSLNNLYKKKSLPLIQYKSGQE